MNGPNDWPEIEMRSAERAAVLEALKQPGNIVEVVAGPGAGKTALVQLISRDASERWGGAVERFAGSPAFPLSEAVDAIAKNLRSARGQSLLVIDDADPLDPGDTIEALSRLSTGPWSFSTIIASRQGLGVGKHVIELSPLSAASFRDFLNSLFKGAFDSEGMDRIWKVTHGNPLLARLLAEHWRTRRSRDLDELVRLFDPVRQPGLLGADGQPLGSGSSSERRIITDVRQVNETLLQRVAENPRMLHDMPSRDFEELVAELLHREGYMYAVSVHETD